MTLPGDPIDPRHPYGPNHPKDPRIPDPRNPEGDGDEPRMNGIKGCSMNMQPDKDLGGHKEGNNSYQRHNRNPFWSYG